MNDTPASDPVPSGQGGAHLGVIVLCGGSSRRMGVPDKTALPFAGATVLDSALTGLPEAAVVVCVGEERPTARPVTWTRERPPSGGPAAGVRAGLDALRPRLGRNAVVAVMAGDQPFAGRAIPWLTATLRRLLGDDPDVLDAVTAPNPGSSAGTDTPGADPAWLLGAYRPAALAEALTGEVDGQGVYATFASLRVQVADLAGAPLPATALALDIDTPADLETAEALAESL